MVHNKFLLNANVLYLPFSITAKLIIPIS